MAEVSRIIDEWLLIEYACTFLPMNQSALVEAVSKSAVKPAILSALGIDAPPVDCGLAATPVVAFTPEAEIRRAIERRIAAFDFEALAQTAIAMEWTEPTVGSSPLQPGYLRPISPFQLNLRHPPQHLTLRVVRLSAAALGLPRRKSASLRCFWRLSRGLLASFRLTGAFRCGTVQI
jgi:hypothetical protein